jgi:DNA-binding transcriptional MocR family regulator
MSQAVMRYFPEGTRVTRPSGGHVLWVQLPDYVDSLDLYTQALKAGITLAPGYLFSATEKYRNFIRLNAAYWSLKAERAMGRLGEIISGMAG